MSAEEVYQLRSASSATGAGSTFKLAGWRMGLGPIAVQIYSTQVTAFVGAVKLQGTIASEDEVSAGTERWSDIDGASWTAETIDALFAKPLYIRSFVSSCTTGVIGVRLAY
jgi:hypothetical protein